MFRSQERAFELFERAFTMECRVSHLVNLMGYHPKYLAVFLDAHQVLMYGDGPLPRYIRVYIAILVSYCRVTCVIFITVCVSVHVCSVCCAGQSVFTVCVFVMLVGGALL